MKEPARAFGNHVFPSRRVSVDPLISEVKDEGNRLRIVATGLYPRKAENRADVGGIFMKYGISSGAFADASAVVNAPGNLVVRETRTMVKNIPILAVWPVFCKVALIPDATPLCWGATEFMTAVIFGAANIPIPAPIMNSINPKSMYAKL